MGCGNDNTGGSQKNRKGAFQLYFIHYFVKFFYDLTNFCYLKHQSRVCFAIVKCLFRWQQPHYQFTIFQFIPMRMCKCSICFDVYLLSVCVCVVTIFCIWTIMMWRACVLFVQRSLCLLILMLKRRLYTVIIYCIYLRPC